MFSIARYSGEEENDTRTFEKKQDRLNKLNSKLSKKRANESEEKPGDEKKKKKKDQKRSIDESAVEKTEEEEDEMEIEDKVEQKDEVEKERKAEQEGTVEQEDKKEDITETDMPALEAFPDMLGRKAKHSKEEIKMLKNMGVPDWLLQPTVVSPKESCDLDKVGLSPWLVQRCTDIGLSSLFAVQKAVIPVFLRHQTLYDTIKVPGDLCISAPTGSGKTMAYALPIVDILSKRVVKRLRAVIVLPTRDLVVQVKETFDAFVKGTDLVVAAVSGQQSFAHEQHVLVGNDEESYPGGKSRVDILVATPGRLIDHLNSTPNFTLQHVRFLVVDEADRLLNQSFNDWLNRILLATNPVLNSEAPLLDFKADKNNIILPDAIAPNFLRSHYKLSPTDLDIPKVPFIQKLLFSATLTKNPAKIAGLHLNDPEYISVQQEDGDSGQKEYTTPEGLKEYMSIVSTEKKPLMVIYLLHQLGVKSGLCFTKSVESTERLQTLINAYEALQPEDKRITVKEYSSELKPSERKTVLKQFKDGEIDLLICSDLIGRGIDLDSVEYVISYDVPVYMDKYIHRVGRTARAGREGTAYTLVEKPQVRYFKDMLRHAGHLNQIEILNVEKEKIQELVPDYEKAMTNVTDTI
ncbi:ATP-dependent RNA helicase dbp6 [Rhizopus stolonifer]|uniref:ATP-dependent RNA helicase n=1 Tax=Rhizopus stolonifer TaxID=4846 RepID=A0A367JPY3_RHIST|nr:ATP-dependent RNA helicase dbp6 [Rhizopus stolonifer]